jgi:quercetin dioxygenase-like cupin family protein
MPIEISHGRDKQSRIVLDVLGPTVEFLVLPSETAAGYCVLKGTIPPGISVPLHSHPDDESFFLLSGSVQSLEHRKDRFAWIELNAGDFGMCLKKSGTLGKTNRISPRLQSL